MLDLIEGWEQRMVDASEDNGQKIRAELEATNRRLRAALAQEQALAAIVELSPAVAFRFRNGPGWALEYVSENVAQFDYSAQDFTTGRVLWPDITHPDDLPRLLTSLPAHEREGCVEYRSTYRIQRPDGQWRWVDDHTIPVRDETGAITHFQGIVVDVTAQRRAQRSALRSERMAAVGMLAAGVAHEFNNVFTSMLGFIQLARETPGVPELALQKLDRTLLIGRRASTITQNLLAYARSWQGVRHKQPIVAVVQAAVDSLEATLTNDGIELDSDVDPDILVSVDSGLLGQVLVNLLINAQHALIARPTKRVRIHAEIHEEQCHLRVQDTGCGIPEHQRERLFLPFFSTKGEHASAGSPQADVRGTGLGLSICDTIVRDHGGSISVQSEVDVGSTFLVTLPLAAVG